MKKKRIFSKRLFCSLVAVLSLFAVCGNNLQAANVLVPANDSPQSMQEPVGETTPSKLRITSSDGKSINLEDFPDRYVVFNYWSASSQECREMNEELVRLEKKYPSSKVVFVFVPIEENEHIVKQTGINSVPDIYVKVPGGLVTHIETNSSGLEEKLDELLK